MLILRLALSAFLVLSAGTALADISVGFTLSATGGAASLGIPEKNSVELLPTTIAGQKVSYIVLDDASDTTNAVKNTRKLITENGVDVIIGSTVTPNSLAMLDVVGEAETPMISLSASAAIVNPQEGKRKWAFKTPQNDSLMAEAISEHMKARGLKTMAYIGFNDPYGENWRKEIGQAAEEAGIKIIADERYNRSDTSVTGQVLKVLAAKPEAVLIGASGTPAALPQLELAKRGYKGAIYQTHGVANADFLRVGGKDVNGAILPVGPMLVYEQLPDENPIKKVAQDYVSKYEAKYGAGSRSTFGGHLWDAYLLLDRAVPEALKNGQPGTREFRTALRAALENVKDLVGIHGVFNMSPTDHSGLDSRARVMVRIENGKWVMLK
jgi:branched-chain amino acid transport system substrate-binding protein